MCEPLTIASLALAGGSMIANKVGADQRAAARSRAVEAEDQRQNNYQNQQTAQFNQTLAKVQKPKTDDAVAQEAADRTASDSKLIDEGGNYVPVTGSAPAEVGQSVARATKQAIARSKEQARLNANVSAVQGVQQKNNIALGRDAQWQGIFANNQQRSSQILPLELEDANRSGAGWRGAGQVLSLASTATGMAGLAGGAPSWGDLFRAGGNPIGDSVAGPTQPGLFRRWFG